MSAYRKCKTTFRNGRLLAKVLRKRFKEVEVNQVAQNLVGYQGDKRTQKAEIIIRRQHVGGSSNDIGFARTDNGEYEAIISDFDSHRHNDKWLKQLAMDYAEEQANETAKENECDLEERTVLPNGAVRLRYVVNGGA